MLSPSWSAKRYLLSSESFLGDFFVWLSSDSMIGMVDVMTIGILLFVGLTLVLGIFEKAGIFAGVGLLTLFYLAHPSFPGLESAAPVEGNYFIVNKNLIELAALLVLWHFPTSQYAGLRQFVIPNALIYAYNPAAEQVDGITSATSKYFADKGLLWTYRDGRRVDSAMLHMREWLSAIRHGTPVSCGIEEGFEEAMTAHMAGLSWKIGRRMDWDPVREEIIALPGEDLDAILLETMV